VAQEPAASASAPAPAPSQTPEHIL
jgi:hypothetical protein